MPNFFDDLWDASSPTTTETNADPSPQSGGFSALWDAADPDKKPEDERNSVQRWLDRQSEVPILGPIASAISHPSAALEGVQHPDQGLKFDVSSIKNQEESPYLTGFAELSRPLADVIPGGHAAHNAVFRNTAFEKEHPLIDTALGTVGGLGEFIAPMAVLGPGAGPTIGGLGLSGVASTIGAGAITGIAGGGANLKSAGLGALGGAIAHGTGVLGEKFLPAATNLAQTVARQGAMAGVGGVAASIPDIALDKDMRDIAQKVASGEKLTPDEESARNRWAVGQLANALAGTAMGAHSEVASRRPEVERLRKQVEADKQAWVNTELPKRETKLDDAYWAEAMRQDAMDAELEAQHLRHQDEMAEAQAETQSDEVRAKALAEYEDKFGKFREKATPVPGDVHTETPEFGPKPPFMSEAMHRAIAEYEAKFGPYREKPVGLGGTVDKAPPEFGPTEDLGVTLPGLPPSPQVQAIAKRKATGAPEGEAPIRLPSDPLTIDRVPAAEASDPLPERMAQERGAAGRPSDSERGRFLFSEDADQSIAGPKDIVLPPVPQMNDPEGVQAWVDRVGKIKFDSALKQAMATKAVDRVRQEMARRRMTDLNPDSIPIEGLSPVAREAVVEPRMAPEEKPVVNTKADVDALVARMGGTPGKPVPPEGYSRLDVRPEAPVEYPVNGTITAPDGSNVSRETIAPDTMFAEAAPGSKPVSAADSPERLAREQRIRAGIARMLPKDVLKGLDVEFRPDLVETGDGRLAAGMYQRATGPEGRAKITVSHGLGDAYAEMTGTQETGHLWLDKVAEKADRAKLLAAALESKPLAGESMKQRVSNAIQNDEGLTPEQMRHELKIVREDKTGEETVVRAAQYMQREAFRAGTWAKRVLTAMNEWVSRFKSVLKGENFTSPEDILRTFIGGEYGKEKLAGGIAPGERVPGLKATNVRMDQALSGAIRRGNLGTASRIEKGIGSTLGYVLSRNTTLGEGATSAFDRLESRKHGTNTYIDSVMADAVRPYQGDPVVSKMFSDAVGVEVDQAKKNALMKAPFSESEQSRIEAVQGREAKMEEAAKIYDERVMGLSEEAKAARKEALDKLRAIDPEAAKGAEKARRAIDYGTSLLQGHVGAAEVIAKTLDHAAFNDATPQQIEDARDWMTDPGGEEPTTLTRQQMNVVRAGQIELANMKDPASMGLASDPKKAVDAMTPNLMHALEMDRGNYVSRLYESGVNRRYAQRVSDNYFAANKRFRAAEEPAAFEAEMRRRADSTTNKDVAAEDWVRVKDMIDLVKEHAAEEQKISPDENYQPMDETTATNTVLALLRAHDISEGGAPNPKPGGGGKIDTSVLQKRSLADPRYQRFYGLIRDNPEATIGKTLWAQHLMSHEARRFRELADSVDAKGRSMFTVDKKPDALAGLQEEIPDSPQFGALAGRYTTKEMKQALVDPMWWNQGGALAKANRILTRAFKVANVPLSLGTQLRQLMQNSTWIGLMNGITPLDLVNASKALKDKGGLYQLAVEHGVSPKSQDVRSNVPEVVEKQAMRSYLAGESMPVQAAIRISGLLKLLKQGVGKAGKAFEYGDYLFKMATFLKQYRTNGGDAKAAADYTRKHTYDYSLLGAGTRDLRESVLTNPFLAFKAEQARVNYNLLRSHPVRFAMVAALVKAAANGFIQKQAADAGIINWDEKDRENWKKAIKLLPQFDQDGYVFPWKSKSGELYYMIADNMVGGSPLIRAMDPTGPGEPTGMSAKDYIGGQPLTEAALIAASGRNSRGEEKSPEGASRIQRAKDVVSAVGPSLLGGSIGRDFPRAWRAFTGEPDKKGIQTPPWAATMGVLGFRPREVYWNQAFEDQMDRSVREYKDQARRDMTNLRNPNVKDPEVRAQARENLTKLYREMQARRVELEQALAAGMQIQRKVTPGASEDIAKARERYNAGMAQLRNVLGGG